MFSAWFFNYIDSKETLQQQRLACCFQHVELKLGKAKLDLSFLNSCKKQSVIPCFLRFKVANSHLYNTAAYWQCQKKLLHEEINQKHSHIRILSSQSTTAYSHLVSLVSALDLIHLKTLTDQENSCKLNWFQKIQHRKLFRLCLDLNGYTSLNPDNNAYWQMTKRTSWEKDWTLLFHYSVLITATSSRCLNYSIDNWKPNAFPTALDTLKIPSKPNLKTSH